MDFEGFPFQVGWELTLECNLRCKHCGSSAGKKRPNELSTKEALSICDQFPALLVQEVDFTGGEPLLRPDWSDIALRLRDLGIVTQIVTNGSSLTENNVSTMKEVGITGVGISLDGLEKIHDGVRGIGSFRNFLNGVHLLQREKIPFTIMTTVNALNINELHAMLKMLLSMGIKRWRLQPVIPFGRVQGFPELKLDEGIYISLENFIRDNWTAAKSKGLTLMRSDGIGYFQEYEADDEPWGGCIAGISTCSITSNGMIKGCLALIDGFIEGDLRKRDLWDIWFDPNSFSYTRKFLNKQLGSNCNNCDKSEQCRGGCSAKSYSYTSKLHNDPYCIYRVNSKN